MIQAGCRTGRSRQGHTSAYGLVAVRPSAAAASYPTVRQEHHRSYPTHLGRRYQATSLAHAACGSSSREAVMRVPGPSATLEMKASTGWLASIVARWIRKQTVSSKWLHIGRSAREERHRGYAGRGPRLWTALRVLQLLRQRLITR